MNEALCGPLTARGYNMVTASGGVFWPSAPSVFDVRIADVAAQLSRICRFNGALKKGIQIYSVAQHSCIVADNLPPELQLAGLLHDAAEAYVGDMIKPIKAALPDYCALENRVLEVLSIAFKVPLAELNHPLIKEADLRAVVTERRDLLVPNEAVNWGDNLPLPFDVKINPVLPDAAERMFLDCFERFGGRARL